MLPHCYRGHVKVVIKCEKIFGKCCLTVIGQDRDCGCDRTITLHKMSCSTSSDSAWWTKVFEVVSFFVSELAEAKVHSDEPV